MAKELQTGHEIFTSYGTLEIPLFRSEFEKVWDVLEKSLVTPEEVVTQLFHDLLKDDDASEYFYNEKIDSWFYSVFEYYSPELKLKTILNAHEQDIEEFTCFYPAFNVYWSYGIVPNMRCLYPDYFDVDLNDKDVEMALVSLFSKYEKCVDEFSVEYKKIYGDAGDPFKAIEKEVNWYRRKSSMLKSMIDEDELPF